MHGPIIETEQLETCHSSGICDCNYFIKLSSKAAVTIKHLVHIFKLLVNEFYTGMLINSQNLLIND